MSVTLVPICAILTIIGVALGMGAGLSLPRASPATGAALLAVRPAGRPGRRLVHGTTGR